MSAIAAIKERYNNLDYDLRRLLVIACCLVVVLITAYVMIFGHLKKLETSKIAREQTLTEMMILKQRHKEAAIASARLTNRIAAVTSEDTPALLIEQSGISIRGGIQSKPLPRSEQNGLIEDGAEITLNGLTANELVNLLHRLEQHQKPVILRHFNAKTNFDDPARIDLIISLALLRAAADGR